MKQKMSFFTFLSAFRIVYTVPFVLASLTGVVVGYFITANLILGLLILWEVFWLAMFVNLSNDYFDFLSGADQKRFSLEAEQKKYVYQKIMSNKVYWQGNLFDLGYLTRKQGKMLLLGIFLLILVSAYPLFRERGILIILIGLLGLILSFFYTAPPVNLGAKGLGEANVFVSFFLMSYFSSYVMTKTHSLNIFLLSVTVGLSGFLMRLADEMTGYDAHIAANEKDISVRFGISFTIRLIFITFLIFYLAITIFLFHYRQLSFLVLYLTLPIAVKIIKIYRSENDEFRIMKAVPMMLKLSVSNSILICISWILFYWIR